MAGMMKGKLMSADAAGIGASSSAKKEKKDDKSYWFDVPLFPSTDEKYLEISFKELVAEKKAKEAEAKLGAGQSILNPYASDDEEDLKAIAARYEAKYGDGDTKKPKKRNRIIDDYVDKGAGYDESDSFIDNSEMYDEILPAELETARGGFYINQGSLAFEEVPVTWDENEPRTGKKVNDAPPLQKKRKRAENTTVMAKASAKTGAKKMALVKKIALARHGLSKPKKVNSILKNPDGSITIVKKKHPAPTSSTSTGAVDVKPKLTERKPDVVTVVSSDDESSSSSSSSSSSGSSGSSSSSSSSSSDEEKEEEREPKAGNIPNQPAKKLKTKNLTEEHRKRLDEHKELRQKIENSSELIITSAAVTPGPKLLKKTEPSPTFSGSNHPTPTGAKAAAPKKSMSPGSQGSTPSMAVLKPEPKKRGPKPKNKTPPLMPLTDTPALAGHNLEIFAKFLEGQQAQSINKQKNKKPQLDASMMGGVPVPGMKPKQPKPARSKAPGGSTQHLNVPMAREKPKANSMEERLKLMGLVLAPPASSTASATYRPPTSAQSSPMEIKKVKPSAASPAQRASPSQSPVSFSFKNQTSTGNKNASTSSFTDLREKSLLNTSGGGPGKSTQKQAQQLPFPIPGLLQAGSVKNNQAHAQYIAAHSSLLNLPNITIAPTTTTANVSGLPTYQLGSGMSQNQTSIPPKKLGSFSMNDILGGSSVVLPKVEPGRNLASMTYGGQGYQNQ